MKLRSRGTLAGVLALGVVLGLPACKTPPPPISSQYEISPDKPDGFALTKNVMLVADNQLNHLYGDPIWMRSELTDQIVSVTIRPIQQDLFAGNVLRWALELYGTRRPVIHLGDGTNIACRGEYEAFSEIMSTAGTWVMAPGNHDAYLLGNVHFEIGSWEKACRRAGGPMTKDILVESYLAHLLDQHEELRGQYGELPASGEWRSQGDAMTFLRAVAWTIDREQPWRSFVVQELDLGLPNSQPPVAVILFDSSQFARAPVLVPTPIAPNAGVTGAVQDDQFAIVEKWLDNGAEARTMTLFMSHHPFGDLAESAQEKIEALRKEHSVTLYVSAHTHNGQYFVRGGADGWLELNVGSIVDWPIEFRTLSIHEDRDHPENLVFRTPLFRIPDSWESLVPPQAPQCDPDWEAKPEDPDYYLSFADGNSPDPLQTQLALMDVALHAYRRLVVTVPSAADNPNWPECCANDEVIVQEIDRALGADLEAKISLLIALGEFDRDRSAADPQVHRDYRVCQAVWASKYDSLGRRQPEASDPYIVYSRPTDDSRGTP